VPYGGRLFDPARFPALEDPRLRVSNQVVCEIPTGLLFTQARVGGQSGLHRSAYSQLDIEQIGTIYEGLLGYAIKRCLSQQTLVVLGSWGNGAGDYQVRSKFDLWG